MKSAFRARNPTPDQRERRRWAGWVSGLGERYNPFTEPDVVVMNYEGRWENHLEGFMEASGEDRPNWVGSDGSDSEIAF